MPRLPPVTTHEPEVVMGEREWNRPTLSPRHLPSPAAVSFPEMLTPQQEALLQEAESVGRDLVGVSRHSGRVDRGLISALAESGLLGRLYPSGGLSAIDLCLIRQGLARANPEAETAFAMQGLGSYPIHQSA